MRLIDQGAQLVLRLAGADANLGSGWRKSWMPYPWKLCRSDWRFFNAGESQIAPAPRSLMYRRRSPHTVERSTLDTRRTGGRSGMLAGGAPSSRLKRSSMRK